MLNILGLWTKFWQQHANLSKLQHVRFETQTGDTRNPLTTASHCNHHFDVSRTSNAVRGISWKASHESLDRNEACICKTNHCKSLTLFERFSWAYKIQYNSILSPQMAQQQFLALLCKDSGAINAGDPAVLFNKASSPSKTSATPKSAIYYQRLG